MADFSQHLEQFRKAGIAVIALSADDREASRQLVDGHKLGFPVIYGLDARRDAQKIGAYFDLQNSYFQPANFILRHRKVVHSTYSSGPLGRLDARQVVQLVDYYRKQEKAPRGR